MRPPDDLPPERDICAAVSSRCGVRSSAGLLGAPDASTVRTGRRSLLGPGLGEPVDGRVLPTPGTSSGASSATAPAMAPAMATLHASFRTTSAASDAATASGVRQAPSSLVLARRRRSDTATPRRPPSFAESQFATIVRRQRKRRLLSPVDLAAGANADGGADVVPLPPQPQSWVPAPGSDKAADVGLDTCGALDCSTGPDHTSAHGEPVEAVAAAASAHPSDPECGPGPDSDSAALELKIGRSGAAVSGRDGWPFAGWGSMSLLELSAASWQGADALLAARPDRVLGTLRAAAVAGNAVTGSIFYTLPAVVAAAGMWSPVSLLLACVLIAPFRWVMVELCASLGAADSANYAFFAHTASMAIAAVAAAATALDALTTGAVSASTAATYLAPYTPGMGETLWVVVLLVTLAALSCLGLGDSARVALGMLTLHMATMLVLMVSAAVWWGTHGSDALRANWAARAALMTGGKTVPRALFDGVCAAFVGLTGFECAPSYAAHVKPGAFPKALLWLQLAVLLVEPAMMLLCLVALSPEQLSDAAHGGSGNILALLGEHVMGGRTWLRTLVTVDATLVLAGGIITGIISFCGLLAALASDRIVPSLVLYLLPRTGAPVVAIIAFCAIALILEATTGFSLSSLSQVFSLSFLVVLALYCIVLFLARLRRPALFHLTTSVPSNSGDGNPNPGHSPRLNPGPSLRTKPTSDRAGDQSRPRPPPPRHTTLPTIGVALGLAVTAIGGNIALNPHALLLYALYALVLWVVIELARTRVRVLRLVLWTLHEAAGDLRAAQWMPVRWKRRGGRSGPGVDAGASVRAGTGARVREWMERERSHAMVYFARGDELSELVGVLTYVSVNEAATRHVYVVHCYEAVEHVPSELEANYQLVDESFPTITVDLVFVESAFSPRTALAVAGHLRVPPSRCLIGCPHRHPAPSVPRAHSQAHLPTHALTRDQQNTSWDMTDLAPLRIIHA